MRSEPDGCTCYDETTRKCPLPGHPERPRRASRDQIVSLLEDIVLDIDDNCDYKLVSEWADELVDPLVAKVEAFLDRVVG